MNESYINPIVIDNVIPVKDAEQIENFIAKPTFCLGFHWVLSTVLGDPFVEEVKEINNTQFMHIFLHETMLDTISPHINVIQPIIKALNPLSMIRIKANLLTATAKPFVHGMHIDGDWNPAFTAIYYVNDNNGHTVFEDGSQIESKRGRLCIFPSHIRHTGTTPTDRDIRVVINFNFITSQSHSLFQHFIKKF